jgi:hypothetical protein
VFYSLCRIFDLYFLWLLLSVSIHKSFCLDELLKTTSNPLQNEICIVITSSFYRFTEIILLFAWMCPLLLLRQMGSTISIEQEEQ